jgi:hypothetical protein
MNVPMILMIIICGLLVLDILVTVFMYKANEEELSILRNRINFVNTKTDGIRDREAKACMRMSNLDARTAKQKAELAALEDEVAALTRKFKAHCKAAAEVKQRDIIAREKK